jgi:hypothetical protein
MSTINKIWSSHSILNNNYTNELVKQAIENPDKALEFKAEWINAKEEIFSRERFSLFFQKLGLTLSLIVPGLNHRIIRAFSAVEGLVKSTAKKLHQEGIKKLREKDAEAKLKEVEAELQSLETKFASATILKTEKESQSLKAKEELQILEDKKIQIPQKLQLIGDYLANKKAADEHVQEKIKNKSIWTREASVRKEAEKDQPHLDFKAKEKELKDQKVPAEDLSNYQQELEMDLANLPDQFQAAKDKVELTSRELEVAKASLTQLEQVKVQLGKTKEAVSKWLQSDVKESAQSIEEKNQEPTEIAAPTSKVVSQTPIKEQMLHDIQTFIHDNIAMVWRGVFDKFDPQNIKSWSCDADGNFQLELNAPMRMWMPSKDESGTQDPSNGVVLTLGLDENGLYSGIVTGKFHPETKDMEFSQGMNFFVKPDESKASPGFINLTHIRYASQEEIHIITNKDLKKDFSRFLLPIIGAVAKKYGTVDNNYNLIVVKKRTFSNMVANWNQEAKAVDNERTAVGLK